MSDTHNDVVRAVNGGTINSTAGNPSNAQVPASITINGSSSQSALVGALFGSLAVTVNDGGGVPIPNLAGVTFTAGTGSSGGSGSFAGPNNTLTIPTDSNGVADPLAFTANDIADSYTVTVTAGSLQATFNMTNTAGGFDHFGFTPPGRHSSAGPSRSS